MSQKPISEMIEQRREYYIKAVEAKNAGKLELCDDFLKRAQSADTELRLAELEERNEPEYDDNDPLRNFAKRGKGLIDRRAAERSMGEAIIKAVKSGFENQRALTSSNSTGALQDPIIRTDFLSAAAANHDIFAKTRMPIVPIDNYSQWATFTDGTPTWQVNEGDAISDAGMTIGSVQARMRTIGIRVMISKQLVRDSSPLITEMIGASLLHTFIDELGRVALSGNGSSEPLGLDGVSGVQEYDVSGAQITTWSAHLNALEKVHSANAEVENCAWVTGSNGMLQIESFDDSTGQYLSKPPVLQNMPFVYSSHVGETYATNKTRVYLGDFTNCMIGISGPFLLPLTTRFADTLQDCFLLWAGVDMIVKRPQELCIIKNVGTI